MPPRFSDLLPSGDARRAPVLIAGLSVLIFLAAALGRHWFNAVVGAGGFYLFGYRLVAWLIASKTGAGEDDTPDPGIDAELGAVLAQLEVARVEMAAEIEQRMRTRLPLGLAGGVAVWAWLQHQYAPPGLLELAAFSATGAGIGWAWASAALAQRYRRMYKDQVLPRLAASFGALTFRAARDIDVGALRKQGLFGAFDHSSVEDEITGTYHGVPISIVELRLERDQDRSRTTVFDGLLASVTLPRSLSGTTAIVADGGAFGALHDLFRKQGARVRLEDALFERRYQVFGTDQVSARALLTPAFMERFLRLGERTGFLAPVALAEDNRLTIALPKADGADLFEPPSYGRPAASRAALARLHADIGAVLAVAEAVLDLDQSARLRAQNS